MYAPESDRRVIECLGIIYDELRESVVILQDLILRQLAVIADQIEYVVRSRLFASPYGTKILIKIITYDLKTCAQGAVWHGIADVFGNEYSFMLDVLQKPHKGGPAEVELIQVSVKLFAAEVFEFHVAADLF